MLKSALTISLLTFAAPAAAQDLIVHFAGGAPKDHISFESTGCSLSNAIVMIDLAGSAGGLIFDTTPGDDGAVSYQPVEITHGYGALSPVRNGDKRLQILVHTLPPGEEFHLSAELNDARDVGTEVAFNGADMAGASVRLALSDRVLKGTFDTAGTATIPLPVDASVCLAAAN
ncbi:MAG: hypothetical protein AAFQ64_03135 [Pseudomonadota bacterium]